MIEVIFGLIFGLTVAAVVGHGIWVIVRTVFRELGSLLGAENQRPLEARVCPHCGEPEPRRAGAFHCDLCGWPSVPAGQARRPRLGLVLTRLRQQVARYHRSGLISFDDRNRLFEALQSPKDVPVPESPRPEFKPQVSKPPPPVPEEVAFRKPRPPVVEPAAPLVPEKPRTKLLDLMTAFFEEKNIRWGELVGGSLIVGCSLALVISFWASIAERPILKFGLFNGVTALIFILGFHAEKRWRLPNTALGLMVIASLLTPLNFLAVASLARGAAIGSNWAPASELTMTALFLALIYRSGRSLVILCPASLVLGVLIPSVAMLLTRILGLGSGLSTLLPLGSIPLIGSFLAVGLLMFRARRDLEIDADRASELLRLLGLSSFASLLALGLLIAKSGPIAQTLHRLAPLAPLAGATALMPGLWLWRRTLSPSLIGYRITGTAIAAGGTLMMLSGIVLAWPDPSGMLPVSVLNFVVLTALAIALDVPLAHVLAGACLTLAYLLVWLVGSGHLTWHPLNSSETAHALLSGSSGMVLAPLVLLFAGATAFAQKLGRRLDAQALAMASALAGVFSVGLLTRHGFGRTGEVSGAEWVFALYALSCLAASSWIARRPLVSDTTAGAEARLLAWIGSALLLAASTQGLVFRGNPSYLPFPRIAALLLHASVCLLISGLLAVWKRSEVLLRLILTRSALGTSLGAVLGLAFVLSTPRSSPLSWHFLWLALVWLVLAWQGVWPLLFSASQAALTGSVVFLTASLLAPQPWFASSPHPWVDPRSLQAQGLVLGTLCLFWIALRLSVRAWSKPEPSRALLLIDPPWPPFDRLPRLAILLILTFLAVYAVLPGAALELTPQSRSTPLGPSPIQAFEVSGIPHRPALGPGSWALLSMVVVVLLAGQWERFRRLDALGLLFALSLSAPLIAARWESDRASASALRWSSALVLFALSVLIWNRARFALWTRRLRWPIDPDRTRGLARDATALVLFLTALPIVLMTLYVNGQALDPRSPGGLLSGGVALFILLASAFSVVEFLSASGLHKARFDWDVIRRPWSRREARRPLLLALVLVAFPLVAMISFAVGLNLATDPILGPKPGSLFARLGTAGSYAPPILLVAVTLVGFSVRDRSPGFAFGAALLLMMASMVGRLLTGVHPGDTFDSLLSARLAHINAVVGSLFALVWIGSVVLWKRHRDDKAPPRFGETLRTLILLGLSMIVLVWITGVSALWLHPNATALPQEISGLWGWSAVLLTSGALFALHRAEGREIAPDWIGLASVGGSVFASMGAAWLDPGDWRTYHVLLSALILVGAGMPLVVWQGAGLWLGFVDHPARKAVVRWSTLCLIVVVLFAIRAYDSDPQSPYWTVGALASMSALSAVLAAWSGWSGYIAIAALLLNLAASFGWWSTSRWQRPVDFWSGFADWLNVNVVALALPVPLWLWIDRRILRPAREARWVWSYPFGRLAARLALFVLAFVVLVGLFDDASGGRARPDLLLGWFAIVATVVALSGELWDHETRAPAAGLYVLGLISVGWSVHQFHLEARWLVWTGTMMLSAYSLATSFLWRRRDALLTLCTRLRIPTARPQTPLSRQSWLIPSNLALATLVLTFAFGSILTDSLTALRTAAAHAALAQVLAIGFLAQGQRRNGLQIVALVVGVIGALAWGWAWISPESPTADLDRLVALSSVLIGTLILYGLGPAKLLPVSEEWSEAALRIVPPLMALGAISVLATAGVEVWASAHHHPVPVSYPALAIQALALLSAAVSSLVAALVPGRDPLNLPEPRRTAYVYASEALLAALLIHIRLSLPWLFSGYFDRYWPLILLAVAFVGVGLSELFRRQGRLVLASPLERTGALLPLLPLLNALRVAPQPGEDVLFLVLLGGLYTTLSMLRASLGFGALATLAYNAALWTWLRRWDNFSIDRHPQVWIIPPALCVLVGAYLNRDRLTQAQSASIRYASAIAIYLSSTADILLIGVAQDPWLPLILAVLSIAGIFAGIALRVRGFLFLGFGFLSLSLFTVIRFAAVDLRQTWIWWASGIVAGILILALFAYFEKRRDEILALTQQLKEWNP